MTDQKSPKICWAPPLRPALLKRLYDSHAAGFQDLALCEKVGIHLYARCNTFVLTSRGEVECPHLFNSGFQHGFQAAIQNRGQEGDKPFLHLNDTIQTVQPKEKTRESPQYRDHTLVDQHRWTNRYYTGEQDTFAMRTSHTVTKFIEENYKAGPFFLWVDFFDPHEPWDPPEYMVKRYQAEYEGIPMLHPNYGKSSVYTSEELINLWAHYAAEAEVVDRAIGRVLQKIDDTQLWDESVVVVTSDHGISIGEHGATGKCNTCKNDARNLPLYPEISHIPFLVASPDVKKGSQHHALAQPIDILPTVSELAGVRLESPEPIEGRSFLDVLTGKQETHRNSALAGCFRKWKDGSRTEFEINQPFLCADKWGFVPVGQESHPELYDLAEDPFAENELSKDKVKIVKEMQDAFIAHIEEFEGTQEVVDYWKKIFSSDFLKVSNI